MAMGTVTDICDRLGRKNMAMRLGVKATAISNAVAAGRFPAKWFLVVREMCAESGVECPDGVFAFTEISDDLRGPRTDRGAA